jgi:hypothetical protein
MPVANPFIIGHHAEREAFCDRTREVARIAAAFRDPSARLLLYGERRLGKSSAIHTAARQARAAGAAAVIVDLASASTAPAAAQRILAAVHREVGARWPDGVTRLLGRLRPGTFTLTGAADVAGQPSVSFQVSPALDPRDPLVVTDVLDAVEAELDARDLTIGLALDEFQRLGHWYGDGVAWQMKELLERHRRIGYVLAGSERTLIEQMLENRKAGLWKVVDVLDMGPIESGELARWITDRARATNVSLDLIVAASIVRLAGPRTRDIVQLARAVWDLAQPAGEVARDSATAAMEVLVREQGALHQRQWDGLTETGRRVLLALAADPDARLLATDTLRTNNLGSKSTVADTVEALVEREVLVREARGAAVSYRFDDPFFRRWVEVDALPDLGRAAPPLPGPSPG